MWEDVDGDGVQDAGEPDLPGVLVALRDGGGTTVATATTSATGSYRFAGLAPGSYSLAFSAPGTYAFTRQNATTTVTVDSDVTPTGPSSGTTVTFLLASGADDTTWDAGVFGLLTLGDRTWVDADRDGLQGADEPPLENVPLRLLAVAADNSTTVVTADWFGGALPATSDASGTYLLRNLPPGRYAVCFTRLEGYAFTSFDPTEPASNSDPLASDPLVAEGCTPPLPPLTSAVLPSGTDDRTIDAGFRSTLVVGDLVWEDLDADGAQDPGEPGIAGVEVTLTGITAGSIRISTSTTTNASGLYLFTDLLRGTYVVSVARPAGYEPTVADATSDVVDSDAATASGVMAPFVLSADDLTRDAGFYRLGAIGDRTWVDADLDGAQDDGEADLDGITVRLDGVDGTGAPVSRATVSSPGNSYRFDGLVPGRYTVTFDEPASYAFTRLNSTSPASDSDAPPGTGTSADIRLVSGQEDLTWDAGYAVAAALGDYVWLDANRNGVQDGGEPPGAGVVVSLTGADLFGNVALSTTTDSSGRYLFTSLRPGTYTVTFAAPLGYGFTTPGAGDPALDSDADGSGRSAPVALAQGQVRLDVDGGLYQLPPPPPPPPTTTAAPTTTTIPVVRPPSTTSPGGLLPESGSDTRGPVALGIALIALGALALLVHRARRSPA